MNGTLVRSPTRDSVRSEGLAGWEATKAPRVLFVDDDPICRRHFEVLLTSRGLTVDVAASADEAIGFARRHQYRVIVCDLLMPRLDGLAVIQRVRPTQSDARYLVTTAAEPSHARGILRGGQLDGVLWKPWEVGSLLAVLERLVLRPERQISLEPSAPLNLDGAILIVSDNQLDVQKLLANLAAGLPKGASVEVAQSLAEAVARVTSDADRPALVLMDQELPDAEGLKAVARLSELGLEAPIIVIGDSADEAVAVRAVQAGAQDYLVRDQADSRRLLRTIRQALGRNDSQAKLTRVALYDQLTGAANRVLFERRTEQAVIAARAADKKLALLFADVDRFKPINDEYGHDVGDALLSAFAMRLADCLAPSDLLSRLGGDEFAVLSTRIQSRAEAQQLATALREAMSVPFEFAGHTLPITASIGLALFPDDASNEKELLRSADVAMYQSKGHLRRAALKTGENDPNPERRDIARSLRPALEQGQFLLHYQPVVTLNTRTPVAVEAFLRWRRSASELLLPGSFLSVLDTTGMIIPVGRWLLREACRDAARFRVLADASLRLSINCTATQVGDRHFAQDVLATLDQRSDQSFALEIELSESTLSSKSEALSESLRELKAVGVSLCMDDFGAGATSLTELRRAGVSTVKIDRSLVSDLRDNEEAQAIVSAIITMGRGLHLRVIAEGVENEWQHELLCALGCEFGQGRLYGAPVGSDELCEVLAEQRRMQRG
jgi:diguanylate cyclase